MSPRHSITCLMALLMAACAGGHRKDAATPAIKPFSQRINEKNGYVQDSEGNWQIKADKRSSFESQANSAYFKGEYTKKSYKTTNYSKKTWWGNKDYQAKEYAGPTDGSRFQKTSRLDGVGASEGGKDAGLARNYKTGDYATGPARETSRKNIQKPTDAETNIRRKVYPAPEVIDWTQQRSLSLEQSKGLLGR